MRGESGRGQPSARSCVAWAVFRLDQHVEVQVGAALFAMVSSAISPMLEQWLQGVVAVQGNRLDG